MGFSVVGRARASPNPPLDPPQACATLLQALRQYLTEINKRRTDRGRQLVHETTHRCECEFIRLQC